jgi:hypothetical protein
VPPSAPPCPGGTPSGAASRSARCWSDARKPAA